MGNKDQLHELIELQASTGVELRAIYVLAIAKAERILADCADRPSLVVVGIERQIRQWKHELDRVIRAEEA